MKNTESFGQAVKSNRIARGLTQEELAEICGLSEREIRNIEYGKTEPRLGAVLRLGAECGININKIAEEYSKGLKKEDVSMR